MGNRAYTMRVGKGKEWGGKGGGVGLEEVKGAIEKAAGDVEWLRGFWEGVEVGGRRGSAGSVGSEGSVRTERGREWSGEEGLEGFALPK